MSAGALEDADVCDLLVVGGGPAGVAAVEGWRAAGGEGRALLLSGDAHPPYFRPSLTKELLRGTQDADELPLRSARWAAEQDVEMRLHTSACVLDAERHEVRLTSGRRVRYAQCVLALGADSAPLDVPGGRAPGVLTVRSLADALRLRTVASRARSAVVVGSGFIGCEAAASLAARGLEVALVTDEAVPHAERLGAEVGERIAGWLRADGIELHGDATVSAVDVGHGVRLADGTSVDGDLVLVAAGTAPRSDLARHSGITTRDQRIVVDAAMRTSAPDVLAAGDCVLAANAAAAGRALPVMHWGEAEAMGEIAGRTAAGAPGSWDAVPGFWSQIGERTLKHVAWGDGFDDVRVVEHGAGAFTAWQFAGERLVGVLTHEADRDHELAADLVRRGATREHPGLGPRLE